MSPVSILFEDSELLIINKPAGVPVQGGKGISHSLDDDLSAMVGYRVHLVHRLDKDTAGLLLVAKNAAAASKWSHAMGSGGVRKEYEAVCIGSPSPGGTEGSGGTLSTSVVAHGRTQEARTAFTVLSRGEACGVPLSHVRLVLGTGRMHQIRIQLAAAGSPVVADDQHGDFRRNKVLRRAGIKKLCLASVRLSLGDMTFEAPLPGHMQSALALMRGQGAADAG